VEVVGLGGRIVGDAGVAGVAAGVAGVAAGVAGAGRRSGKRICQRCWDDTAVVGVIGYGEIVRKHQETELNAREIDDDEGGAGVEEVEVNWPWDLRALRWNPWRVEKNLIVPCGKVRGGSEVRTCYLDRIETGEEGMVRMVEGTEDENPLVWFEVYRTKPGKRPLRWVDWKLFLDLICWKRWISGRKRDIEDGGRKGKSVKSKASI
jgi:hypothetical protein